MFTKFASNKVPPVMVSTHGSVVPLAMFTYKKLNFWKCHLIKNSSFEINRDPCVFTWYLETGLDVLKIFRRKYNCGSEGEKIQEWPAGVAINC